MNRSIEQILGEDEHIVAIHAPKYDLIPEVNYSMFVAEARDKVRGMVRIVSEYMSYPLIEDNFGLSHNERRVWREQMEERHGELFISYYRKNKLRGNVYGSVVQALRLIAIKIEDIEQKEKLISRVIDITRFFPDNYDSLGASVKINTMRNVEEKVYDFLQTMQR